MSLRYIDKNIKLPEQVLEPRSSLCDILANNSIPKKKSRKIVGNYSYLEDSLIGWGYTSKVYKGKKINDSKFQYVAIKKIPIESLDDLHINLLQNQIRVVKKINHPNIVSCYDVLFTKKNCYIIMQYCEEGSLQSNLKSSISLDDKMKIISDLCCGFRYLTYMGIVHRDLKPGNILKKDGVWKIADFGFAVQLTQAIKDINISVGTPLYMAPQSLSKRVYSHQSDIFALGIIFYQIITNGKLLWIEKTKKKILQSIMNFEYKKIELPFPFNQTFFIKLLQIDPQFRPIAQKISLGNLLINLTKSLQTENNPIDSNLQYQSIHKPNQLIKFQYLIELILKNNYLLKKFKYLGLQLKKALLFQLYHIRKFTNNPQSLSQQNINNQFQQIDQSLLINYLPNSKKFCLYTLDIIKKILKILPSDYKIQEDSQFKQMNIFIKNDKNVGDLQSYFILKQGLICLRDLFQITSKSNKTPKVQPPTLKKILSEGNLWNFQKFSKTKGSNEPF